MKREFLEALNLDKEMIDKILAENGNDIEREKAKTLQAKADLADAQAQLKERTKDLEELKKTAGNAEEVQRQLEELTNKYETESAEWKKQSKERDYADAMTAAISGANLKFSSKFAEKAFREELKEKALKLVDGALEGFNDYVKEVQKSDPGTFAPEKPPASIVSKTGPGSAPPSEPENVRHAREMGAKRVAAIQASNDIISKYI